MDDMQSKGSDVRSQGTRFAEWWNRKANKAAKKVPLQNNKPKTQIHGKEAA